MVLEPLVILDGVVNLHELVGPNRVACRCRQLVQAGGSMGEGRHIAEKSQEDHIDDEVGYIELLFW